MSKKNLNKQFKVLNLTSLNITILFGIVMYILFQFVMYDHYPAHDELKSITLLSSIKTSLIKFSAHNHFLSTQLGNLIISIFGVDILKIRLLSLLSFIFLILLFQIKTNNYLSSYVFILIYLSSDIILTYFSLYRGYAISALLFSFIFFLILDEKNKLKNYKIIYILLSLLILHNQSTLYIIIPILIGTTFNLLSSENKFNLISYKIFFIYFFFPFIFLIITMSIIEGIYLSKIFITLDNFEFIYLKILKNIPEIFWLGFLGIFFNEYTNVTLYGSLDKFLQIINENLLFFSIFLISLIKSIYFIFIKKKKNTLDLIIFIFFVVFFVINRNAPIRVYTGFISFFIIYILYDFNLELFKIRKNYLNIFFCISLPLIIIIKINNIDFIKIEDTEKKYKLFEKNRNDCDFPSKKYTSEFDKHLEYYVYLNKCEKKPNINKFYKYYKY